jgi:alpha-beta hydrolase superfamily lysophospholipase
VRLTVGLILVSCAHTPDLALRPDPSPPTGSTTETFAASDGTQLLARHWSATADNQYGVVVVMHGLKDHSARYTNFATTLARGGFAVYAFDLRGHGRSAGPRVAPAAWTDYVDDLDKFLSWVEQREPGKPVFLFGHSMGGAIAARVAELHPVAGLVLSGPALAIDAAPLLIAATRMSGFVTPRFPALDLDNRDFSSDPAGAGAMDHDELISQPAAPASTAAGLVEGIHTIWRDVDRLTMPLLVLHGSADRLTAPAGSRMLVERAPSKQKILKIYEGFYHDLVHEPNGQSVAEDVVLWLAGATGRAQLMPVPIYAGPLAGDPRGWSQAVQLEGGISAHTHAAGRLAIEIARPRPIGWHGALTARVLNGGWAVAFRPVGVAARLGAGVIGASAGASLITNTIFALSAGAWLEQPLGPLHAGAFGELDRRGASIYTGGVSLRLGGDRSYWPHAHAGVGPVITAGAQRATDTAWFVTAGLELYAVD